MESRHIKWEYNEAVPIKKEVLHSQLNLINMMNHLRNFRMLRRRSIITRNQIRACMTSIRAKSVIVLSSFPKDEKQYKAVKILERSMEEKPSPMQMQTQMQPSLQRNDEALHRELEDIKAQLARFG